jgi:hypothetical protein
MVSVQVGQDFNVYYTSTAADINGLVGHKFASGTLIGFVNNLSYTVEHNVEGYGGVGKREPWGIKEGAYGVTINLEGLWIDSGAQSFFLAQSMVSGALTPFAIAFSGTDKGVAFSGCRVGTFDAEISADGWATSTVDIPAIVVL